MFPAASAASWAALLVGRRDHGARVRRRPGVLDGAADGAVGTVGQPAGELGGHAVEPLGAQIEPVLAGVGPGLPEGPGLLAGAAERHLEPLRGAGGLEHRLGGRQFGADARQLRGRGPGLGDRLLVLGDPGGPRLGGLRPALAGGPQLRDAPVERGELAPDAGRAGDLRQEGSRLSGGVAQLARQAAGRLGALGHLGPCRSRRVPVRGGCLGGDRRPPGRLEDVPDGLGAATGLALGAQRFQLGGLREQRVELPDRAVDDAHAARRAPGRRPARRPLP